MPLCAFQWSVRRCCAGRAQASSDRRSANGRLLYSHQTVRSNRLNLVKCQGCVLAMELSSGRACCRDICRIHSIGLRQQPCPRNSAVSVELTLDSGPRHCKATSNSELQLLFRPPRALRAESHGTRTTFPLAPHDPLQRTVIFVTIMMSFSKHATGWCVWRPRYRTFTWTRLSSVERIANSLTTCRG